MMDVGHTPYMLSLSLVEQEMVLRLRIQRLCGSQKIAEQITPAGVKTARAGAERFARENGLSGEEQIALARLIPGHVFEVYQGCHAAYMRQVR